MSESVGTALEIRRAGAADFDSVVALSTANLATNLSDEQKRDGFLSVGWTAEQYAAMNDDLAVIIAVQDKVVKAFLCASTVQFNLPFDLPKAMIDQFPHAMYDGKPLTEWRAFIGGPVCVDASLRGQGILEKLYACLYEMVAPQYDLAIVFVSTTNPRSIKAHEKVGMQVVDEFEFNSRRLVIMAGRTHS